MPSQRCPCGVTYQFPQSAIGKRARCKKCGLIFLLEPDETSSIPLDGNFDLDESRHLPAPAPIREPPREAAFDDEEPSPPLAVELPSRGYFASVLWTLLFPTSSHNLITFVVLWIALWLATAAVQIAPAAGLGGLPGGMLLRFLSMAVVLWFACFRFAVIESASAGEDELPDVGFTGEWLNDVVVPALKWVGSWLVVLIPAVAWLIFSYHRRTISADHLPVLIINGVLEGVQGLPAEAAQALSSGHRDVVVFLILSGAGMFLWPMVVLCVALGGFGTAFRIDLMARSIMGALPAYLATVFAVGAAITLKFVIAGSVASGVGSGTGVGGAVGSSLFVSMLATGVALYFDIVAMRMIGLYYHHFKHRFAWDWG